MDNPAAAHLELRIRPRPGHEPAADVALVDLGFAPPVTSPRPTATLQYISIKVWRPVF